MGSHPAVFLYCGEQGSIFEFKSRKSTDAYGISGPFWYAAGATIQILLFAMLSVQLKIRAPGAKTFLQVIRARFGATTHKVFCFYALLTNIIVTANLMLGKIQIFGFFKSL
ncbi:hypothetical protein CHS0354_027457 [Potamilus streckersoni]|uniref:Uncharacterized protein n=1 Tax=Potamilus streckersoni TaxID=2493646 RepID=A0AAE0W841_9BIVA|nr:hypothetical protein CHS0354_027457 [Potamilus streckersoni]